MSAAEYADAREREIHDAAQAARIAELEAGIHKALKHAKSKGMQEWPIFVGLRKLVTK